MLNEERQPEKQLYVGGGGNGRCVEFKQDQPVSLILGVGLLELFLPMQGGFVYVR